MITLKSKRLSKDFSSTTVQKHQFFGAQLIYGELSHQYMTNGKTLDLTLCPFVGKVMSLLINMLSRLVIAFLPRSKCPLISWLQSPCAVIWESKNKKFLTVSIDSPSICHELMGLDAKTLVF